MARDFAGNSSSYLRGISHPFPPDLEPWGPPWLPLGTYPWTMAAWFNHDVVANDRVLSLALDRASSSHISINVTGSVGRFSARDISSGAQHAVTTNTYSTNTWNHLVGVAHSTMDRQCYLNGDVANKGTNTASRTPNWNVVGIGHLPDLTPASFIDGQICECAIWIRALRDIEIIGLSQGKSPLFYLEGLVWYRDLRGDNSDLDRPFGGSDLDPLGNVGTSLVDHPPQIVYPTGSKRRRARFPKLVVPHSIITPPLGIEVTVVNPSNPVVGL